MKKKILVTGGAGYVGCVLVPKLLDQGFEVLVYDSMIFGSDGLKAHPGLQMVQGDIRDMDLFAAKLDGVDTIIHLACISNDPSFELEPGLSKLINFDSFEPMVKAAKTRKVKRFIYASTSSVYGVSDAPEVTEDHALVPLTDYNKYKGLSEPRLLKYQSPDFTTVILRPATVCGYSPRQRLDLTVNILTNHAVNKGVITVFGGNQKRPNIHIDDICELYVRLVEEPKELIAGEIFNAGYQNHTVNEIAQMVKKVVEEEMPEKAPILIKTSPTDDNRSYHVSSEKIRRKLGFVPKRSLEDAIRDLCDAFKKGLLPNSFEDDNYFNVKVVKKQAPREFVPRNEVAVVTGGAGFIGSHLVDLLLEEGRRVRVIDNFSTGRQKNLEKHRQNQFLQIEEMDIRNLNPSDSVFSDVGTVFHVAGMGDIVPSIERPLDYFSVNVMGTVRVLEAARFHGARKVVYTASSSCYGKDPRIPTDEKAEIKPEYPYALSKYQGEEAVLHWHKVYGLKANSIRIFNAYGARSRTTGAYGAVFGVFLAQKLAGQPFTVVGDGSQRRDFVYVTDLARALLMAAETELSGQVYNVGAGRPQTVNRLVELLGGERVLLPKRPGEPECTWANITKIQNELGWKPEITFEQGVEQMLQVIEDWRDAPVWNTQSIHEATKTWFEMLSPA